MIRGWISLMYGYNIMFSKTELSEMFQFKFDRYITRVAAIPRHIEILLH